MLTRWRLIVSIVGVLVLVVLASIIGERYYARWRARCDLDEAIAELDAVDPRWRLDDIEADRRLVPDAENSAHVVVAAHALLPRNWHVELMNELSDLHPTIELTANQADKLNEELTAVEAARKRARELQDLPFGRHKLVFAPDYISTLITDQSNVRAISALLDLDACDALHRKDMKQAWESNRAILNASRSLGDEPMLISALIRVAIDWFAVRNMERALAQGAMPPAHLEERQRAFEEESTFPMFLLGVRGERAGNHMLLSNIEAGNLKLLATLEGAGRGKATESNWWDFVPEFFAFPMVYRSHATILRMETEMVEAAKLPPAQRYKTLAQIDQSVRARLVPGDRSLVLAGLLVPAVSKIAEAEQRNHTLLACAVAGLAAERFRLVGGRWPDSWGELVQAGLLREVPLDLYDGNPLRLRRSADGLVIYSVYKDGLYDGKLLDRLDHDDLTKTLVIRVEFRLWDPPHRRKAPVPAVKQAP